MTVWKYEVNDLGYAYGKGLTYKLIRIEKFDHHDKLIEGKGFYFLVNKRNYCDVLSYLKDESIVDKVFSYKEYTRFKIYYKAVIEKI